MAIRYSRRAYLQLGLMALTSVTVFARGAVAGNTYQESGAAISGTDPVAYFTKGHVIKGETSISYDWNGAHWLFSTQEHKTLFMDNPEKYAPQFGGYCAFAVSKGQLAPTNPEAWTIHNGKLYLNFSTRARDLWRADLEGNIAKGEVNWPRLK